jgi:hypothetical protein
MKGCHMARDIGQRFEFGPRRRSKHHPIAFSFDQHFGAWEPEGLGKSNSLTPTMLKELSCRHSYIL